MIIESLMNEEKRLLYFEASLEHLSYHEEEDGGHGLKWRP